MAGGKTLEIREDAKGSALRQARLNRGLSLEKSCMIMGINEGSLSRMERGEQYPRRDTVLKFTYFYPELSIENIVFPVGR